MPIHTWQGTHKCSGQERAIREPISKCFVFFEVVYVSVVTQVVFCSAVTLLACWHGSYDLWGPWRWNTCFIWFKRLTCQNNFHASFNANFKKRKSAHCTAPMTSQSSQNWWPLKKATANVSVRLYRRLWFSLIKRLYHGVLLTHPCHLLFSWGHTRYLAPRKVIRVDPTKVRNLKILGYAKLFPFDSKQTHKTVAVIFKYEKRRYKYDSMFSEFIF